jgi:hypothetical protein
MVRPRDGQCEVGSGQRPNSWKGDDDDDDDDDDDYDDKVN